MTTLYEEVGGESTIEKAIDGMYDRVLRDPILAPFFDDIEMSRLQRMFRAFLHVATGGPRKYSGLELRAAHANVVYKGLEDQHFTAMLNHLRIALHELSVNNDHIERIMTIMESNRGDVLGG